MSQKTLNLGILAHVDAGKTTLTERLLYEAGMIAEPGSVDAGTTQTDSLALEQQRGITIKSAVVSFAIGEVAVNLIDTPGHPDFIAEVERVLRVLDGAVLVVSAVEGVQSQTPLLMRALQRLRVPTLIFVNKIDRAEGDPDRVLEAISARLSPSVVRVGSSDSGFATRLTEVLAERDDRILAAYVEDGDGVSYERLYEALTSQTREAHVHPVFFGSARTGAGVSALMTGIAELLPSVERDGDGPLSGAVFKIERGPAADRIAYVRLFSGTLRTRDRVPVAREGEGKVTALEVYAPGDRPISAAAGDIAKVWGLTQVRIGDDVGEPCARDAGRPFAPPMLESVVVPRDPGAMGELRIALAQLAEQDPLINVRQDDLLQELSVSLYGEVQEQVIQATLASDYGLEVTFRDTTPICIERPTRPGEAVEILNAETNPFHAEIGLRVEPAPEGNGVGFRLDVDPRAIPLYVYKTKSSFREHMEEYVRETFREGVFGWEVTDCLVTMTRCWYTIADGPPSRRGPLSTAADFRKLTPIVLMEALELARPAVCVPIDRATLEVPVETLGVVIPALVRLDVVVETPSIAGERAIVEAVVPADRVHELQRRLPALTGGEGVVETEFGGYQPAAGHAPTRRRTRPNPLNRQEYLMQMALP